MDNTIVKVGGMTCQGCVANVSKVLSALPGVDQVSVSLDKGEAAVVFNPAVVSRPALCVAVEDAGFDAA